jgi:HEAT repeat protein
MNLSRASMKLGIGRRSASRWAADPSFAQRVTQLRSEMTAKALGMLAGSMSAAAKRLRKLLDDPQATVRHKAAVSILEMQAKLNAAATVEQRLAELESRLPALPALYSQRNGHAQN